MKNVVVRDDGSCSTKRKECSCLATPRLLSPKVTFAQIPEKSRLSRASHARRATPHGYFDHIVHPSLRFSQFPEIKDIPQQSRKSSILSIWPKFSQFLENKDIPEIVYFVNLAKILPRATPHGYFNHIVHPSLRFSQFPEIEDIPQQSPTIPNNPQQFPKSSILSIWPKYTILLLLYKTKTEKYCFYFTKPKQKNRASTLQNQNRKIKDILKIVYFVNLAKIDDIPKVPIILENNLAWSLSGGKFLIS